jgi:chromate transporter
VRAIPGPVFSVASYSGGMMMKDGGFRDQILGCIIGAVAIFLPSTLLLLFFFPVWQNLKKFAIAYRALEGINAVVTGFMFAGVLYLLKESFSVTIDIPSLLVFISTTLLLLYTRTPTPVIVFCCLLLGLFI